MVDALSRRNATTNTDVTPDVVPANTAVVATPSTTPIDAIVVGSARTHHVEPLRTTPTSLVDLVRESPTTRAVILGAGGLMSLFAGTSASAATVNIGATDVTRQAGPKSIVYVGMNADAQHEVDELQGRIGTAGVTFVKPSKVPDTVIHNGKTYDLKTAEGRLAFGTAIGLPADKAQALASILEDTNDGARDEAAQLARTFREAEKGSRTIERIVLSGHSIGSGVWGDGNGYLQLDTINKLTMLFPKAAGQVQDLMMAACYSGGESKIETYTTMFPNLRSVWAYDGSAPGAWSGSVPHVNRWEKATRGAGGDTMSRNLATGTRKGDHVAVWTAVKGYDNGQTKGPIEDARAAYTTSHAVVAGFQSGADVVTDSQTGPLRDHYNNVQHLLARPDLPASERQDMEKERDLVIRILYFKNVGTMFQTTFSHDIASAYQNVGLDAPNFANLSRKDALAQVKTLEDKIASTPSASTATKAFATRLHSAIVDLSPAQVPAAWL